MNKLFKWLKIKLTKNPEKQKDSIENIAGRLFVAFFVIMLLFTILSRIADSMTIAKVETETIKQGSLNFTIKGSGTIEANAQKYMMIRQNARIVDVFVKQGDKVEEGTHLFQYDMNSLQQQLDTLEEEIVKTEKNIKKLQLNMQLEKIQQSNSEEDVDTTALEKSKGDVEEAKQKLENAKTDFAKTKKKAYEDAKKYYNIAQNDLKSLEADITSSKADIKAQKKVVEEAKSTYEDAKEIYEQIENDSYDYSSDIGDYYQAVYSAERSVEEENHALAKAQEQKNKSDAKNKEMQSFNQQIASQDVDVSQMELDKANKSANEIRELINADGIKSADTAGTVLECDLKAGIITTGSEKLSFAGNEYYLNAQIPKESTKRISVGDTLKLDIEGSQKPLTIEIERIELNASDDNSQEGSGNMVEMVGKIEESEYKVGDILNFSIEKQSKAYSQVVPIQSLHMESENKFYVLVLDSKNTILGNEIVVTKLDVTVLEKDYKLAAIESSLTNEIQIITSSNKNIATGDRVRVTNE